MGLVEVHIDSEAINFVPKLRMVNEHNKEGYKESNDPQSPCMDNKTSVDVHMGVGGSEMPNLQNNSQ